MHIFVFLNCLSCNNVHICSLKTPIWHPYFKLFLVKFIPEAHHLDWITFLLNVLYTKYWLPTFKNTETFTFMTWLFSGRCSYQKECILVRFLECASDFIVSERNLIFFLQHNILFHINTVESIYHEPRTSCLHRCKNMIS